MPLTYLADLLRGSDPSTAALPCLPDPQCGLLIGNSTRPLHVLADEASMKLSPTVLLKPLHMPPDKQNIAASAGRGGLQAHEHQSRSHLTSGMCALLQCSMC